MAEVHAESRESTDLSTRLLKKIAPCVSTYISQPIHNSDS